MGAQDLRVLGELGGLLTLRRRPGDACVAPTNGPVSARPRLGGSEQIGGTKGPAKAEAALHITPEMNPLDCDRSAPTVISVLRGARQGMDTSAGMTTRAPKTSEFLENSEVC